jgi:hypothetical protein
MRNAEVLRIARWVLLGAAVPAAWAQSSQQAAVAPVKAPAVRRMERSIMFSGEKPVSGLPPQSNRSAAHCSGDNMAFFNVTGSSETGAMPELYRISPGGEVTHLMRKLPMNFDTVSMKDFYAGDQTLVTLLEAVKLADGLGDRPVRETDYFLSISDHDGDLSKLVQLDVRFKPLRIAVFGSGEYLLLGWDEANQLPVVTILKDDGSVRRFLDMEERRPDAAHERAAEPEQVSLEELQASVFVPYGSNVLLTYPGSTKPVRVLSAVGDVRSVRLELPGGYVLHDVLVSGDRGNFIVRVQAVGAKPDKDDPDKEPVRRLFEMDPSTGKNFREIVFDKPRVSDVTCAAQMRLTAIFSDTIASPDKTAATGKDTESAMHLVAATAHR